MALRNLWRENFATNREDYRRRTRRICTIRSKSEEGKSTTTEQINQPRLPINLQSLTSEERKIFRHSFDIIFLDCGGVIHDVHGSLNKVPETIKELLKEGKTIRYVTNSNRITNAHVVEKLRKNGYESVTEEAVVSPMGLLVNYIRDKLPDGKSVYVVGPELLCEEIRRVSIHCFGPGEDKMSAKMYEDISKVDLKLPDNVGAVIVGFDVHVNYLKILKAYRFLSDEECLYILLSPAPTSSLKAENGDRFPTGASIAATISLATGRKPFILGKPGTLLIETLRSMAKDPGRALFVGDQLDPDVLTGQSCAFRTLFVLSGTDKLDKIEKYIGSKNPGHQMCIPDFYANSLADLVF